MSIVTLLKEQIRVSRLSFSDVIKRISAYNNYHPVYISSNIQAVERYLVVHGQMIFQLFSKYSDERIRKCAFVSGLLAKMQNTQYSRCVVKKKKLFQKSRITRNPRALMAPGLSKRATMKATTTKFINWIWSDYFSKLSLEDTYNDEEEMNKYTEKDAKGNKLPFLGKTDESFSVSNSSKCCLPMRKPKWASEVIGKTNLGEDLYQQAVVDGELIGIGSSVLTKIGKDTIICIVEYMYETANGEMLLHGRQMLLCSQTILGTIGNEREVFLTNNCLDIEVKQIEQTVTVVIQKSLWGHQHRKGNLSADEADRVKAEERNRNLLPVEYYCKSLYWPEKGAFLRLPYDTLGIGSGFCYSCDLKQSQKENGAFKLNSCKTGFEYNSTEFTVLDFVYVRYDQFSANMAERGTLKSSRNIGLKAYVICQIMDIVIPRYPEEADCMSTHVKVRRFFRPEDISTEMTYLSDIREVSFPICETYEESLIALCICLQLEFGLLRFFTVRRYTQYPLTLLKEGVKSEGNMMCHHLIA